jgi:hypothetical protein
VNAGVSAIDLGGLPGVVAIPGMGGGWVAGSGVAEFR